MKIIEQSYQLIDFPLESMILNRLELISRVCYKSEENIEIYYTCTKCKKNFKSIYYANMSFPKESCDECGGILEDHGTSKRFVKALIKNKHDAMLEHYTLAVKFITDRGVSHEIVRHRLASYAQESTRYCNYSHDRFNREITVIRPAFWSDYSSVFQDWKSAMRIAENHYFSILKNGGTPQEARTVLPNSLKTEIVMAANIREWRHFFKLRTASDAHPQMRALAIPLLNEYQKRYNAIFGDIIVNG